MLRPLYTLPHCAHCGNSTVCQLSKTVARNTAEADFGSTSGKLHETLSGGNTLTAAIACNTSSSVVLCVRVCMVHGVTMKAANIKISEIANTDVVITVNVTVKAI